MSRAQRRQQWRAQWRNRPEHDRDNDPLLRPRRERRLLWKSKFVKREDDSADSE